MDFYTHIMEFPVMLLNSKLVVNSLKSGAVAMTVNTIIQVKISGKLVIGIEYLHRCPCCQEFGDGFSEGCVEHLEKRIISENMRKRQGPYLLLLETEKVSRNEFHLFFSKCLARTGKLGSFMETLCDDVKKTLEHSTYKEDFVNIVGYNNVDIVDDAGGSPPRALATTADGFGGSQLRRGMKTVGGIDGSSLGRGGIDSNGVDSSVRGAATGVQIVSSP
uniref:Gag-pol polyprotein n=1 Tax=Angiostrongylus cantonensis TaxID=6313 RepID=A0A0K0CSQ4_ANGCA